MSRQYDAGGADAPLRTEGTTELVGYRLRQAQLRVFQRFRTAFETEGLRPAEYSVLVLIGDNPGRKQTEIADALGIKRANFVPLVNGLEKRGLVARRQAAADRRANALVLTAAGERFLTEARRIHDAMEAEIVALVGGEAERKALFALLDRLA